MVSYIERYYASLPKPEAKLGAEVQQLVWRNIRLWTHAHNPLILSLTCDFYRIAHENQQEKLTDLTLLDLYNCSLSAFIRRYLDKQSQYLNKSEWSWESTKEWSLDELLIECSVEVDFLQTLSYLGISQGTLMCQHFSGQSY